MFFSSVKSLFTGPLKIVLVFAILTNALALSEFLLGNTSVTMAILKSVWAPFH